MVSGVGVNMVRWTALAALATVPKSPISSYCFLIRDSCRPVAAASACHNKLLDSIPQYTHTLCGEQPSVQ